MIGYDDRIGSRIEFKIGLFIIFLCLTSVKSLCISLPTGLPQMLVGYESSSEEDSDAEVEIFSSTTQKSIQNSIQSSSSQKIHGHEDRMEEEEVPPYEKIEKDTDRDYFLSAEEAKNYGLIDRVITHPSES